MNNITWHTQIIEKKRRASQKQQKSFILWFTGLSGSGKSTLANALDEKLFELNYHTYLLDGDNMRCGLNKDLGFTDKDRIENIRRIGEVAKLFVDSGLIVLCTFISPFYKDRNFVRKLVEENEFIEIFIDTPLEICELRDCKGLYGKARKGEITNFTGISSPYEIPINPDIHINNENIEFNIEMIVDFLVQKNLIKNNKNII